VATWNGANHQIDTLAVDWDRIQQNSEPLQRQLGDQVWIAGRQEHHPEGRCFLEWHDQGKRRRQAVGQIDNVAGAAYRKALELSGQNAGLIPTPPARVKAPPKIKIGAAIDSYPEFVERHRSSRTHISYRFTLHDAATVLYQGACG
jgi:hypothetical protein